MISIVFGFFWDTLNNCQVGFAAGKGMECVHRITFETLFKDCSLYFTCSYQLSSQIRCSVFDSLYTLKRRSQKNRAIDMRMRSHRLLWLDDNKSAASCQQA